VAALQSSQPRKLDIAHHLHAPAQLIKAVRLGKPALLIVRQPRAAVSSFNLWYPCVSVSLILNSWLHFHRALLPYASGMAIATFDQVTSDLGAVIDAVNARFGTSFNRFEHTTANVEKLFRVLESRDKKLSGDEKINELSVARPSSERSKRTAELELQWQDVRLSRRREEADSLYEKFSALAGASDRWLADPNGNPNAPRTP
jgi:hypothetical protein